MRQSITEVTAESITMRPDRMEAFLRRPNVAVLSWMTPAGEPMSTPIWYRYADGSGEIGVIASVTQPFCRDCTRARLSADGKLYTCLFATAGRDLRPLLRGGSSDEEIAAVLRSLWAVRRDRYSELRTNDTPGLPKVEMSYIGG